LLTMAKTITLTCDGCGQTASGEHTARRLLRLEWSTRYRPVHIGTLLLGAFSPPEDADFLYAPGGEFRGEAALLLDAVGISTAGKEAEAVRAEFQRAGYFLTHVLECPLEGDLPLGTATTTLLGNRIQSVARRIRRSLKPKRVMVVTEGLEPVVQDIVMLDLGCPVLVDRGKPFRLESYLGESSVERFQEVLGGLRSRLT